MSDTVERLIAPGTRLMQVLNLRLKFALISAAFMVPLCVAVYGVVSYAMSNIEFAQEERAGSAYLATLNQFMAALSERRVDSGASVTDRGVRALDAAKKLNQSQQNS